MSFAEACRKVAEQFIRTVVVIDDRGFAEPPPGAVTFEAAPPDSRSYEPPSLENQTGSGSPEPPGDPDPVKHDLDGAGLTRRFAAMGINCAIYVPDQGEPCLDSAEVGEGSPPRTLARRADIVVVDWLLDGRNSKQARDFIRCTLLDDRRQGGRLRLLAVYTGADDLRAHRRDLHSDLEAADMQLRDDDADGVVALSGQQLRVIFLHKDHDALPVREHVVAEAELPARLVEEFSRLTQGIMPGVALAAITAVRDGTHNILAKFDRALDPALAAHRSMLTTPSDAEDYALRLVAEELHTRLDGEGADMFRPTAALFSDWVDHLAEQGRVFNLTGKPGNQVAPDQVKTLLVKGASEHELVGKGDGSSSVGKRNVWQHLTYLFSTTLVEAEVANLTFARMALLRREAYGTPDLPQGWFPTLTLGAVVARLPSPSDTVEASSLEYLLCMQPRCDAVHLPENRPFPFLPLNVCEGLQDRFSFVVRVRGGKDLKLEPKSSPYEIRMVVFARTAGMDVVRGDRTSEGFLFQDVEGDRYEWLGELRPSAAQRVAQQMSSQIGRVGLDEFDWLRQKAGRS